MKKILTAVLAISALLVASCGNKTDEVTIPKVERIDIMGESVITEQDFLKADGRDLKNGNGDLVNLRGVNLGGYLIQEMWMTPTVSVSGITDQDDINRVLTERFGVEQATELIDTWEENYITEDDFILLSKMGVNTVRLPFWWKNLMNEDGSFIYYDEKSDDPYAYAFRRLDWVLKMAGKYGMYVILDCHGAPGSQNGSDHSGIDGENDKVSASEFFFGDNVEANQELYYKLWEVIAERYKDNPIVAGYDLLNEPYCTYRYNSPKGLSDNDLHTMLWTVYNTAYEKIRAIDGDHVIIMEATWDAVDLPNPEDYSWENVMYEYHNYKYDDYDNAQNEQIKSMVTKMNGIYLANYNVPTLMGEFNYFNNIDAWDEGLKLLTEAGVNWTVWTYKTINSTGNWGFVHHLGKMDNAVYLNNMGFDEIKELYEKVGTNEGNKNERLINVVSTWAKAETCKNLLGKN